jgi:hypothetical protein
MKRSLCIAIALFAAPVAAGLAADPLPAAPGSGAMGVAEPAVAGQPGGVTGGLFPVSGIHPGLRGTARTVFEGDHLEEFEVEFLGVLKNAIGPQQDMILARLHGPKVEFTGVVAGMSGSPVYVDGRLVGALSYRIGTFTKEPIAGITPIADMMKLATLDTKEGAREPERHADLLGWLERGPDRGSLSMFGGGRTPGPAASVSGLEPIGTPLVCAGCDPEVLRYFTPAFESMGLQPTAGGGADPEASAAAGPLVPGAAIGAALATGDLNLSAIGTLTHVDGDRVFAFGHPMTGLGPVQIPMTQAQVVLTLASDAGSFKIANATAPIGTILEDRLTAIMGEVGRVAPTLPLTVSVAGAAGSRVFHYDVVRDRNWAPMIVALTTANSLVRTTDFDASATVALRYHIDIDGRPEVVYEDLYAGTSASQPVHLLVANDAGGLLGLIYNNPFEEPAVRAVRAEVRILEPAQVASLTSVSASRSEVKAGEPFKVFATIAPFRGPERVVSFDVAIPEDTPPGDVQVIVGGSSALDGLDRRVLERQLSQASGLGDILRLVGRQRRSNALYLRVTRRAPSAIVRSEILPDLPLSVFSVYNNPRLNADATLLLEAPVLEVAKDLDLATVGGRRITLKVK